MASASPLQSLLHPSYTEPDSARTQRSPTMPADGVRLTPEGRRVLALGIPTARATEEALLSFLPTAQRSLVQSLRVSLTYQ